MSTDESRELAAAALGRLAAEPERLRAFMVATGLDPTRIRAAAAAPGFPAAVLDYLAGDEATLIEVSAELGCGPDRLMAARQALSPEAGPDP